MATNNKQALKRRKKSNVVSINSTSHARRMASRFRVVHGQEVVTTNLLTFPLGGRNHGRPMPIRDSTALLPLGGAPMTHTDIRSHVSNGVPTLKQGRKGLHARYITRDRLSPQEGPSFPVTDEWAVRTIRPMGRALTPVAFNKKLAELLRSARVAAGYETQKDLAEALGVSLARYKKWETGRTPIQHEYIKRACELLGKDANYFFQTIPVISPREKNHEKEDATRSLRRANP